MTFGILEKRFFDPDFRVWTRWMFAVHNGRTSRVRVTGKTRQQSLLQIHTNDNLDDRIGHANHSESYR